MAGKYDPDSARRSVEVPFASGLQDPRLGLAENVSLYEVNDAFSGKTKYLTTRPSLEMTTQILETTTGLSIESPLDAVTTPLYPTYVILATTKNIYYYDTTATATATGELAGADKANYVSNAGSYDYPIKLVAYQDTTSAGWKHFLANTTSNCLYTLEVMGAHGTVALGFSPNPMGVSLDGYVFLAKKGTNIIYNSNLNDITTWNIGVNYIMASQVSGSVLALQRQKNYVLAFKTDSIEYFYNAGLTNTSPLQRQDSYTKEIGARYANSISKVGDDLLFVGHKRNSEEVAVYHLTIEGATKVSTTSVDRYLKDINEDDPYTRRVSGFCTTVDNKSFYILSVDQTSPGDSFTLVYDILEGVWSVWSFDLARLPLTCGVYFQGLGNLYFGDGLYTSVASSSSYIGYLREGESTSGVKKTKDYLATFSGPSYFPVNLVTRIPTFDFGTGNRKFLHEISVSGVTPSTLLHRVEFVKTVGGGRATIVHSTEDGDNLNMKNWGQFNSGYINYYLSDPSSSATVGLDASYIRLNSLNMEVSQGLS